MEKKTEAAAQPPPYETHTGASGNAKEDAASYETLSVPRQIMDKILTVRPHAERMRLINGYIRKKGRVIKTRDAALSGQDRALADAIKKVKRDVRGIQGTSSRVLWKIAVETTHPIRGFFAAIVKYGQLKSEKAAFPDLIAAGEKEARRAYQVEVDKAEAEFRDAAKQLDEKFMAYVENVLAKMEGSEASN
ncbi:hypothetical protein TgHK011_005724 [Trichoderma gracile]|nr:hypothetical protein TgHK011_005724 [Trichoderma gracile]